MYLKYSETDNLHVKVSNFELNPLCNYITIDFTVANFSSGLFLFDFLLKSLHTAAAELINQNKPIKLSRWGFPATFCGLDSI